ncbi:MAG: FemAB family XrtA/PEP-CTERM system-associated protein [Pseudomonadota bacterium]
MAEAARDADVIAFTPKSASDAPATAPLLVRSVEPRDKLAWDRFVDAAPGAVFFHRAAWPGVIERTYGHKDCSLIAMRGGEVAGVLPLNLVKSPIFGKSLISTAFTVGGGVLAADAQAREALAAAAVDIGEKNQVDCVEMRFVDAALDGWVTKKDVYAGFRKQIPADEDENLKMIPRKKRADVRKGIKNQALAVDADADIDVFYALYAESVRNLGTPVFPVSLIRNLKDAFGDDMELSVISGPDGPVVGLASFFFKDEVLPYYGGAQPAARALHAYDYQYWSLMRRAAARGATVFDFGRSKYGAGAFDYKTYWGFEPEPLHYQYKLIRAKAAPDVNPMNPKYRLMVNVWRRLPLALANRLGPIVASQLG